MIMLKSFFEIGTDKTLFDGLYISGNKELCDEHMGKYPVIFLSFKGVEGLELDAACEAAMAQIKASAMTRFCGMRAGVIF